MLLKTADFKQSLIACMFRLFALSLPLLWDGFSLV